MVAVAGLAYAAPDARGDGAVEFALAYFAMRAVLIGLYLRAWRHVVEVRSATAVYLVVVDRLGDDLLFAYRHFPLSTVHPHAALAGEAAEAAGSQGRFWEMHGLLYANQQPPGASRPRGAS